MLQITSLGFSVFFKKSIRDTNHMGFKVEAAKIFVEMWGEMESLDIWHLSQMESFFDKY